MQNVWNFLNSGTTALIMAVIALIYLLVTYIRATKVVNKNRRQYREKAQECKTRLQELNNYYSQFGIILLRDKPLHLINRISGNDLIPLNGCEFHLRPIVPWSDLFNKGLIVDFDGTDVPNDDPYQTPRVWFRPKAVVEVNDAVVKSVFENEIVVESKTLGRTTLKKEKDVRPGAPISVFQQVKETPQGYLVFYTQFIEF